MKSYKNREINIEELRNKDIYTIDYKVPAFIASPVDKYVDRGGPFDDKIFELSNKMDEILLEQGTLAVEKLDPFINDGVIGYLNWNKSYQVLNCIVNQNVHSFNAHISGSEHNYQLLYNLSIIGRERCVNNLVKILNGEYWDPNPFQNKIMNPVIKRYENPQELRPNDFNSISELVDKLQMVATMGYKGNKKTDWEWLK